MCKGREWNREASKSLKYRDLGLDRQERDRAQVDIKLTGRREFLMSRREISLESKCIRSLRFSFPFPASVPIG